jgi:hypothetical protein
MAPKRKDAANPADAALAKQAKPGQGGAAKPKPINTPGADVLPMRPSESSWTLVRSSAIATIDATNNNGFFARWGETAPQRLGVLAGTQHMRNGVQL